MTIMGPIGTDIDPQGTKLGHKRPMWVLGTTMEKMGLY